MEYVITDSNKEVYVADRYEVDIDEYNNKWLVIRKPDVIVRINIIHVVKIEHFGNEKGYFDVAVGMTLPN